MTCSMIHNYIRIEVVFKMHTENKKKKILNKDMDVYKSKRRGEKSVMQESPV